MKPIRERISERVWRVIRLPREAQDRWLRESGLISEQMLDTLRNGWATIIADYGRDEAIRQIKEILPGPVTFAPFEWTVTNLIEEEDEVVAHRRLAALLPPPADST